MSQLSTPVPGAAAPAPTPPPVRACAAYYRSRGLAVCRIKPGEKSPSTPGWPTRSAEPGEFAPDEGIGLLPGPLSAAGRPGHALVVIDLDSPPALAAADAHLPPTGMVEGRPGKPRSHRCFLLPLDSIPPWATSTAEQAAPAARAAAGHPGPRKFAFRGPDGTTHYDFLGTGSAVVCPPSAHTSGELREWEGGVVGEPPVVSFDELWVRLCSLAGAVGAVVPNAAAAPAAGVPAAPTAARGGEADAAATSCPIPAVERLKLARRYLADVPDDELSRSEHGGHNRFYRHLSAAGNGFLVRDRDLLIGVAQESNARLTQLAVLRPGEGFEPWSAAEVAHKVDDVLAAGPPAGKAPGWLLPGGGEPPRQWNDPRLLGERVAADHTLRLLGGRWYAHDGVAYVRVLDEVVRHLVQRHAEAAAEEHFRAAQQGPGSRAGVAAVVPPVTITAVSNAVASLAARVALPPKTEFDVHLSDGATRDCLTVANGVLHLGTRHLGPPDPDWFSLAALPVGYDPAAPAPAKWLRFINQVTCGDDALAGLLQQVTGWCLDRQSAVQAFVMLVGAGANGKSVFLYVLGQLLGPRNVAAVPLDQLAGRQSRFAGFGLLGRLANLVGDQGYFESGDESVLKTLTGGDPFAFEEKGMMPVYQPNRCKLIFGCNQLPTFKDRSEGTWRRAVLAPFDWTVPLPDRDPALLTPGYWEVELPGILNWALDGLGRLRGRGRFELPQACMALAAGHRLDSDPIRQFLDERYKFTGEEGHLVPTQHMYEEYQTWCGDRGLDRPVLYNTFARQVGLVFPNSEAKTVRFGGVLKKARVGLWPVGAGRPAGGGLFGNAGGGPDAAT
ncbi:MAG TPA: phage/plasmid primase, P4 family [Urbifossiella sp.]|nr:phage/plasmid primase, P4 family [Urbifossiella sp.]